MDGEAKEAKRTIRAAMLAERGALDAVWIASASAEIARRVMALDVYRAAGTVCLFAALAGEVRLEALREDCLRAGRRVLLPAYRPEARAYGFKEWKAGAALRTGHWGVPEPDLETFAGLEGQVCMIVPGLAFDAGGGRIGYGGGHYDRLLQTPVGGGALSAAGVCFDFQMRETLPREVWDRQVDVVVTERRTMVCRQTIVQANNAGGGGPVQVLSKVE